MSILVHGGAYGDAVTEGLRRAAPTEDFTTSREPDGIPDDADVLVTLLDEPAAVPPLLRPSIRWVHVLGAGVDGFPLDVLGDRVLTCSRGAASPAIAEWVLAMMLAFEKDLPNSWISTPPARWNHATLGGLSGRTLGLVGVGAIGSAVAHRALAFDVQVLACRRTPAPLKVPGVELTSDLEELLPRSDHVVVAAPATPETFHLFDHSAFAHCKPGMHLVNISRGGLIDQEALRVALDTHVVARASLDTVDPEPLPPGHWLYEHPAVRLSPHISWSSRTTLQRTFAMFIDNLRRFRRGESLLGVVDPIAGY